MFRCTFQWGGQEAEEGGHEDDCVAHARQFASLGTGTAGQFPSLPLCTAGQFSVCPCLYCVSCLILILWNGFMRKLFLSVQCVLFNSYIVEHIYMYTLLLYCLSCPRLILWKGFLHMLHASYTRHRHWKTVLKYISAIVCLQWKCQYLCFFAARVKWLYTDRLVCLHWILSPALLKSFTLFVVEISFCQLPVTKQLNFGMPVLAFWKTVWL